MSLCCLSACGGTTPTSPTPSTCSDVKGAITLRQGEILRVRFTAAPTEFSDRALLVNMGESSTVGTVMPWHFQFHLFDGLTLLSVYSSDGDLGAVAWFRSPDNMLRTPPVPEDAGVADFRSIANGTIDGRVELSLTGAPRVLNRANLASIGILGLAADGFIHEFPTTVTAREWCR